MEINKKEFSKSIVGFLAFFVIMYVGGYYGCMILEKHWNYGDKVPCNRA